MELLGTIVRLQVQRASLKAGQAPGRYYDPAPITAVPALTLDDGGVTGHDAEGRPVPDVHHRDHPASRHRGENGVSIGFTAHYDAMRARFGDHLTDGIAGENILARNEGLIGADGLNAGIVVVTADGQELRLGAAQVAEPCVEFGRHALRLPRDARSDAAVGAALAFLRRGLRGYYLTYDGAPATVRVGDLVYRLQEDRNV